ALQHSLPDVHAKNAYRSLGLGVQASGKRKQCCLPGAVEPEQYGEIAGCDRERYIFQYPSWPETVSETFDRQCRNGVHRRLSSDSLSPPQKRGLRISDAAGGGWVPVFAGTTDNISVTGGKRRPKGPARPEPT